MNTPALSPISQARFHAGCSLKHAGKVIGALWCSTVGRLVLLLILGLVLLSVSGCSTTGGGWNPLSAWFGRKAAAETKAEAKAVAIEDATVKAAQVEVVKTGVALKAAKAENPGSRAVDVADRTNTNAANLLNQRAPLTVKELEEAVATANGLLSVETALREKAERSQVAVERENRATAEELGSLREQIKTLRGERAAEAANNLATANELRAANIWKWSSTAASVLFGIAAFAYRANAFGMASKVAEGLVHLEKTQGAGTADVARGALDVALDMGDKNKIFAALQQISPVIAHRVSTS